MAHFKRYRATKVVVRSVLFAVASLVLASCGAATTTSLSARSHATPIATASPNPSSLCGSDEGDDVNQSLNGDFTACFRVPNLGGSSVVVALQAVLLDTLRPTNLTTTTTTTSVPAPPKHDLSLTLSPTTVTPGEAVVVTGHLVRPLTQQQPLPTICWDGCNALEDQGGTVKWTSPTTFHLTFHAPESAWLVSHHGVVSVHPLTSGNYEVGLQCFTSISGCALGPAEAHAEIHLNAPKPTRCVGAQRCETMSLSTYRSSVGDEILVKGWAPLQNIIGRPFTYSLSLTSGPVRTSYPALAFGRLEKSGAVNVVLTPKVLRVEPAPTWAALGRIRYASSSYSGPSAIDTSSTSNLIAWCQSSGIEITGGSSEMKVSTLGVRSALVGSGLRIFSKPPYIPQCAAVQLDPHYADSIYAGFGTAQGNSIPPVYLAALYSTNDGATWHVVPSPPGTTAEDFAGFTTEGSSVEALFSGADYSSGRGVPMGTDHGLESAEVTSNGGSTWTSTTLGCPVSGPCVTFGSFQWGNCNMSNDMQSLLLGPVGSSARSGVTWTSSSWVTSLNSCFPQQLVVSSSHELFLLDPSSQYPLLQSTDSGSTWTYRALPRIAAANYGADSVPMGNSLVLAPDGSLFAAITTPSNSSQELFRLKPSATTWCEIPHVFGTSIKSSGEVGPLRVSESDLLWSQTIVASNGTSTSTMHAKPYSTLTC